MFTINAQFLSKQLSCCPVRDYSENGADDRNENKCDIETAHVEPCSLSRTYSGQSMGNGTRNALTSKERIHTQLQNATQHKLHHAILTWYDSISDNSIFVIFIVIIYLTQSDPITETIYALAIV